MLSKQEDLTLIPRAHVKTLGMLLCTCEPRTRWAEIVGSLVSYD